MKILQIGKFPKEHCGGVESAVFGLSEALSRGHVVEVVTSGLEIKGEVERSGNLTVRKLPTWGVLFSAPLTPSLISYLRKASFDIIQISFQNPMAVLAYWLARPKGKLVIWYHHDIVRQRFLGLLIAPLLRWMMRRADAIVATSAAYAKSSRLLKAWAAKTAVIALGVDGGPLNDPREIDWAGRIQAHYGAPLVLFIGRLVYYKGLGTLIEAMRGLDAKLLIIGSGPLEPELRKLADKLELNGKVIFEKLPREEPIGRYLHACDLLVLPSVERTEAYGLTLLEAMACGKPVVATELGTGTSFVCEHESNGLVVPPGDVKALRGALARLLADPALRRRLGEEGRRRFKRSFTAEAMAKSFVSLYEKLLLSRHASGI